MNQPIFSGDVLIELQGDNALNLVQLKENSVNYLVNGFEEKIIAIEDYRKPARNGLKFYLKTSMVDQFHSNFNAPAYAIIEKNNKKDLKVILHPTNNRKPDNILWIAIGIGEIIPSYDYLLIDSRPMRVNQFALFALYYYPGQPLTVPIPYSHFVQDEHI